MGMMDMSRFFIYGFMAINILTFCLYGWDKYCAVRHRWRLSEFLLLGTAALGGSVGALLAMNLFRHKTRHFTFAYGVPFLLMVHGALVVLFLYL